MDYNNSNNQNTLDDEVVKDEVGTAPIFTVHQWLKFFLIMSIPLLNIVYLLNTAFTKNDYVNPNLKNYAKGVLIYTACVFGIMLGLMLFMGTVFLGAML